MSMEEGKKEENETSEAERREMFEEIEKIVKNPHHFGNSFSEVAEILNDLGASESQFIRAGKHPYFWMTQRAILQYREED